VIDGPLSAWILTALVQGAVGYVQYAGGLPAGLVAVHVAGATALMGITAWAWTAAR
jgi:cytochrome c oxidase assembly protein subunit 15